MRDGKRKTERRTETEGSSERETKRAWEGVRESARIGKEEWKEWGGIGV